MNKGAVRHDIQFESGGIQCRGWLYKSERDGKAPAIILAHGFCGVKEMRLDAFAERFASAGYHALVFDYRHFGDSDGKPRQLLDIKKQHDDWRAAIRYARSLPDSDTDRIVLWGTSFSGGHVLQVAVETGGVAAVISQVPHLSGPASAMAAGMVQNIRLGIASFRDHAGSLLGMGTYYVNALGRPGDLAAMTAPGEYEASRKLFPREGRFNETVAARIFLALSRYSPGKVASKLTVPWLVQAATKDATTPSRIAEKATKKAPKGELIVYERGHFDVYVQPDFERTVADQIDFLRRHIG